jgi:hypothetical protein
VSPETNMPDWSPHVRSRLSSLRLSPTRENEIVDELSQHLDDRWQELTAGGASPEEATRLALADFREGNVLARHLAPMRQAHAPTPIAPGAPARFLRGDLWRDVRYAVRMLRKQPSFAIAAIVTLALAIGATTAIFTVVDAFLLRSLPFPDADRIVQVGRAFPAEFGSAVSQVKFLHWRKEGQQVFSETAAYNDLGTGFSMVGSAGPERLTGSLVTAGFFEVLGVQPVLGRTFTRAEDVPGGPRLVVLSHALLEEPLRSKPGHRRPGDLAQYRALHRDWCHAGGFWLPGGRLPLDAFSV